MLFAQSAKAIKDNIIDPVGDFLGVSGFAKEAREWRDNGYELTRPIYDRDRDAYNYRTALKHTHRGSDTIPVTFDEKIAADRQAELVQNARHELKTRGASLGLKRI